MSDRRRQQHAKRTRRWVWAMRPACGLHSAARVSSSRPWGGGGERSPALSKKCAVPANTLLALGRTVALLLCIYMPPGGSVHVIRGRGPPTHLPRQSTPTRGRASDPVPGGRQGGIQPFTHSAEVRTGQIVRATWAHGRRAPCASLRHAAAAQAQRRRPCRRAASRRARRPPPGRALSPRGSP
jgi:hypothetical protein